VTLIPTIATASTAGPSEIVAIPARRAELDIQLLGPAMIGSVERPEDLSAELASAHGFSAKAGEVLALRQLGQPTIALIGIGDGDLEGWRRFGAAATRAAAPGGSVALVVADDAATAEQAVLGALLATYRFSRHKSAEQPTGLASLEVIGEDHLALAPVVAAATVVADAVAFAKDLINEPAGDLPPSELAERAAVRLEASGRTRVEIWDEVRLAEERCGAIVGVGKGSAVPPRLVRADYVPAGADDTTPKVVLVGKGVTFDSGGLSLKPATGMMTMKTDMTGAAVVLAVVSACDALGVKVKVTAIAPMAENMPSGAAMRPGDVLVTRSGTTIEVLNTDAEGRLLLADGLALAVELEPTVVVDLATLTGAQVVALGTELAARYANDRDLDAALAAASETSGELSWSMPLHHGYDAHLDSEVADLKNIGKAGEAGSISAALFLDRFVGDTPWAHLDLAGPGRSDSDAGYRSKGATAYGVRLLLTWLRSMA